MTNIEKEYQKSLDFLYSFVDFSLTRQLRFSPEKFNLNRMVQLMDLLGNPQDKFPTVHIAGTKGKGSTAAMLANILQHAGYKVGLYTSPHLVDFCERIQVNGMPISHEEVNTLVNSNKQIFGSVEEITTFELTTALGFLYFEQNKVDIAVIEVGLGGRLDATNIITPVVSVITSLSFDHMNILGNTIEEIAGEKAGIIKERVPVVISPQVYLAATAVVKEVASKKNSPIYDVDELYNYSSNAHTLYRQKISIWKKSDTRNKLDITIPLVGQHQVENATTCFCVTDVLVSKGFQISGTAITEGFRAVDWPGRFEVLQEKPLLIIDSAHNQDSAQKLSKTITEYLPKKEITLIFGASEDKEVEKMFVYLLPLVKTVILTKSTHPRAAEPKDLVKLAEGFGKEIIETRSVEEALESSLNKANNSDAIVVTGSIFIAAAVREIIMKDKEKNIHEG